MELISCKGVNKSFGKNVVLNKINFTLNQGEFIGVVGPSGSGKSMFIKTLIGFLKPNSGYLNISPDVKIGFSMQNNSLYPYLTVRQNLIYFSKIYNAPKKEIKKDIDYLLKRLDLEKFEKYLVKNLSGGTKKRVDIACCLINNPNILFLDEPFVGLDPSLIKVLSDFLSTLNKEGRTIVMSSHRILELSSLCSRFVLIKEGNLKEIKKSEIMKAYD